MLEHVLELSVVSGDAIYQANVSSNSLPFPVTYCAVLSGNRLRVNDSTLFGQLLQTGGHHNDSYEKLHLLLF